MNITPILAFIVILLTSCSRQNALERTFTIYSQNVRDSFEVYVNVPSTYRKGDSCDVFYYLDANLKSGKKIRKFIQESSKRISKQTIYVGIGHIGNYRVLRRRDLTVPKIEKGDTVGKSENFGQIEEFYNFFKAELIPTINTRYTTTNNNSILGHSFGGLFSVYCLFKNDTLFEKFYSLSPSLWINDYSIYDFNHLPDSSVKKRRLFLSVGGREIFNRIKSGADDFADFIKRKGYSYLSFEYKVYDGETHNSQVSLSIEDIFIP